MGKVLPKKRLHYLVRLPEGEAPHPPLLILLHGSRSNEEWMFEYADVLPPAFLIVAVRAPLQYGLKSFSWFEVDEKGLSLTNKRKLLDSVNGIVAFIDEIVSEYKADSSKVVLMGFSQGGISCYNTIFTHPEKFMATIVLGGRIVEDIKPLVVRAKRIRGVKFFVGHGVKDEVVRVEKADEAVKYLQEMGIEPYYRRYSEKHTINGEMLWEVNEWLSKLLP